MINTAFYQVNEINKTTSYTCAECWTKVELFHEFYRTTEFIHKKRTDDVEQSNPLYDCDRDDEPEYKTILIPMPIVVVERLPDIVENGNNEISTAENVPQEDECAPKRSTPSEKARTKKRKKSQSKSSKTEQKIRKRERSHKEIIATVDKIV